MKSSKKGAFALISYGLIYATTGIYIRAMKSMFTDYGQIFFRLFIALIVTTAVVLYKKYSLKIERNKIKYVILFALTWPLAMVFFTISILSTKVVNSIFSLYITTLLTTLTAGIIIFKEKLTQKKIFALVSVICGLIFLTYPFEALALKGIFFGLLAGILEGVLHTFRKYLGDINRYTLLLYQFITGVILLSLILFFSQEGAIKEVSSSAIIAGVVFGILTVVVGTLAIYGFKHFDLNLGTILMSSELLFALIINALILSEYPTSNELIGGVFIMTAVVFANLPKKTKTTDLND